MVFLVIDRRPAPYEAMEIDNAVDVELLVPVIEKLFEVTYAESFDGGFEIVALKGKEQ